MKKINFLFAILCLAVMSCNPSDDSDSNTNSATDFTKNFGAVASHDFIGQVVDVNNLPIQNAAVKIGASTVQTDVNGVFIINGANVYEKFAYITAKKVGYVDGSRAMIPTSGKNNVKIMMILSAPIATIQAGVSSEVALPSGTKVVFDGAFETEAGVAYTGSVVVSMFHLKSSDENISSLMPGMLYAQAADGLPKVLETFGMMEVELRSSGGEKLQIAKTHTAQINMPIDASQLATAPSSIPLWHFDEENGYWKEEGSATKVGNQYVGTVSHFSWWNCDTFSSTVSLTVKVVDSIGNPLSNVGVGLVVTSSNFTSYILYTDNNGQVSGLIPANQTLTLNNYSSIECSTAPVNTMSIGPFSVDTVLADIVLNTSGNNLMAATVQGSLLKCDNTTVTNGYVSLNYGNQTQFVTVTNGDFSFNTTYCNLNSNFKLKGVDYDSLQTTDSISYNFTSPITNVGNLNACNAVTEFISYQIDTNAPTYYTNYFQCFTDGNSFYMNGNGIDDAEELGFYLTGNTFIPGIYNTSEFRIDNYLTGPIDSTITNSVQFNLSQFGAVGGYIDLTFNGTYTNLSGTHTVSGVAHVKRDN